MFEGLVSIATLMLCTFLATVVVAIFMTQLWLRHPEQSMAGFWAASTWCGSLASLLLAMRDILPPLVAVGLGNALACLAYGLMWAGFRAFDRRSVTGWWIACGAAIWCALFLLVPALREDVNHRIMLMSLVIFAYSALIGRDVLIGKATDDLPARNLAAFFFVSHGIIYLLRIPFAIFAPASLKFGTAYSPWFAVFSVELFVHTVVAAITMLVMIKERAEYAYKRAAETDGLTGIKNRRCFVGDVGAALALAPGRGCLMIFDLDHFKAVNDTWGHVAGDRVLVRFAETVSTRLQPEMIFCRFGGEEFSLFAPGIDSRSALLFAESIRQSIEAMDVASDTGSVRVTVSIGLSSIEQLGADFDRLLAAADAALYEAKRGGRNRVIAYDASTTLRRVVEGYRPDSAGVSGVRTTVGMAS